MIIRAKLIIQVAKVKIIQTKKTNNRADQKNLIPNQNPNQKSTRMIPINPEVIVFRILISKKGKINYYNNLKNKLKQKKILRLSKIFRRNKI